MTADPPAPAPILPARGEGDRPKAGGGGSPSGQRPAVYAARRLRKQMSLPEVLPWQALRKRPGGLKFRRQHAVEPYAADFYCAQAHLVVEVDGASHDGAGRDLVRDAFLESKGMRVLHVAASEILADADSVSTWIAEEATSPLHHASHGPPRRERGGSPSPNGSE